MFLVIDSIEIIYSMLYVFLLKKIENDLIKKLSCKHHSALRVKLRRKIYYLKLPLKTIYPFILFTIRGF